MPTSTDELLKAKEAVQALLESLSLAAYLFEVEPREDQWELRVDCSVDQGWQSIVCQLTKKPCLKAKRTTLHATAYCPNCTSTSPLARPLQVQIRSTFC